MTAMVAVLATLLLLIVNASGAFAQTTPSAGAEQVPSGKVRVTWPKATRALQRGEVLSAANFVLADTLISWTWSSAPTDTAHAVTGWVTRRTIAEGEFMHGPSVAPANVIEMGSTVQVLWQDRGVRLTLTGTATNNAALGAPVGVRIDKNRRLDGIAVAPNTVRLR